MGKMEEAQGMETIIPKMLGERRANPIPEVAAMGGKAEAVGEACLMTSPTTYGRTRCAGLAGLKKIWPQLTPICRSYWA